MPAHVHGLRTSAITSKVLIERFSPAVALRRGPGIERIFGKAGSGISGIALVPCRSHRTHNGFELGLGKFAFRLACLWHLRLRVVERYQSEAHYGSQASENGN